jgi:hypothetical protein
MNTVHTVQYKLLHCNSIISDATTVEAGKRLREK